MRESQASIAEWAEETFGGVHSLPRVAARVNEEMAELLRAVTADENDISKLADECADILIVLYRFAHLLGIDLLSQVDVKMSVNRARVWKLDGTGHGYHVRDKAVAP